MLDILELLAKINLDLPQEDLSDFEEVYLYEYDLTEIKSKCSTDTLRHFADLYIGKTPHLSIVVYGREFEVESEGPRWIQLQSVCINGKFNFFNENKMKCLNSYQDPDRPEPKIITYLGSTRCGLENIMAFFDHITSRRFRSGSYNVFVNNCIEFARTMSYRLVGKNLPKKYSMVPAKKVVTAISSAYLPYVRMIDAALQTSSTEAPITEAVQHGISEFANAVVDYTPLGMPLTFIGAATTTAASAACVFAETTVDVASTVGETTVKVASNVVETTGEAACVVVKSVAETTSATIGFFSKLF